MRKTIINQEAFLNHFQEKLNAEMVAAARPIIDKALSDIEKEMCRKLGAMVISLLDYSIEVSRNESSLRILIKDEESLTVVESGKATPQASEPDDLKFTVTVIGKQKSDDITVQVGFSPPISKGDHHEWEDSGAGRFVNDLLDLLREQERI